MKFGKLFKSPADAISEAKKKPDTRDAVGTLAVGAILAAIAAVILLMQASTPVPVFLATGAVSVFIAVLIGGIFAAYLLMLTVNTLGGKGKFLQALTTVAYSIAVPAAGLLIAAIVLAVPLIGAGLAFVALSITLVLGAATLYRATKELFSVDLITAFVALSILIGILVVTMSIASAMLGLSAGAGLFPLGTLPTGI